MNHKLEKLLRSLKWFIVTILSFVFISRVFVPNCKFRTPTATVAFDTNGYLLGAKIASDGQWRFPKVDSVPKKFETCIKLYEDQYFDFHPGINPISILRALRINIKSGKTVQGGSTLTMQVARLMGTGGSRSIGKKIKELFISLHLEINCSKKEILALYASNAPFGGNVVGLDAAAWRYYSRSASQLSWAEYAVLAVLPNAPSLIYPGKNEDKLRNKRNKLLDKLKENGHIDEQTCKLSKLEELPSKPFPLPQFSYHLLDRVANSHQGQSVITTIDKFVQQQVQTIINRHVEQLSSNEINNAAAIVIDVNTNTILAYVGNATNSWEHNNAVDIIKARRSTGSLLKPFLYGSMLTSGELLPQMLIPDIPTFIAGYSPKNYYLSYDGAVKANEALYRSLNVPFVRLLRQHGVERFYSTLKKMNMSSLVFDSGHYGLSLILGGAEGKLIEMSSMYASLARVLMSFNNTFDYSYSDYGVASYLNSQKEQVRDGQKVISAAAIYNTFEALSQVNRPISEKGWKAFSSARKIAWKTGTSFGNKDAWAVGTTPKYVVGVWVGNADGEGRTGLTGVSVAAPIMFKIYNSLGSTSWFQEPYEDMELTTVCKTSGCRSSIYCEQIDTLFVPKVNKKLKNCSYHHMAHLTKDRKYQVNSDCERVENIENVKWFTLPPAQEWFYKRRSPLYKVLPPYRSDCDGSSAVIMDFIYPKNNNKVYIPIELDGSLGRVIFEIAHRNTTSKIYWHLDGIYLGYTQDFHQLDINARKGWHQLVVVDESGNELIKKFEVISN